MFNPRTIPRNSQIFELTNEDKANLDFLLRKTPEELADWILEADQEDLLYAREIAEINHVLNVDQASLVNQDAAKWVLQKYMPVVQKPLAKENGLRRIGVWLRNKFRN